MPPRLSTHLQPSQSRKLQPPRGALQAGRAPGHGPIVPPFQALLSPLHCDRHLMPPRRLTPPLGLARRSCAILRLGIYQVYTLMLVYIWYILGIYLVYTNVTKLDTWWLVLRGRIGPHSTRAACDNISRHCDDSDFITPLAPTARILAPGHVSVRGAL